MSARVLIERPDVRFLPDPLGPSFEVVGEGAGAVADLVVNVEPDVLTCASCARRVGWVFDCRADPEVLDWVPVSLAPTSPSSRLLCEECAEGS